LKGIRKKVMKRCPNFFWKKEDGGPNSSHAKIIVIANAKIRDFNMGLLCAG
jgi:hypothetical protein